MGWLRGYFQAMFSIRQGGRRGARPVQAVADQTT